MDAVIEKNSLPEINRAPRTRHQFCIKPASKLIRISYGCGEPDHLHRWIPEPHLGNHHLKCRATSLRVNHVDFVDNQKRDIGNPPCVVA